MLSFILFIGGGGMERGYIYCWGTKMVGKCICTAGATMSFHVDLTWHYQFCGNIASLSLVLHERINQVRQQTILVLLLQVCSSFGIFDEILTAVCCNFPSILYEC